MIKLPLCILLIIGQMSTLSRAYDPGDNVKVVGVDEFGRQFAINGDGNDGVQIEAFEFSDEGPVPKLEDLIRAGRLNSEIFRDIGEIEEIVPSNAAYSNTQSRFKREIDAKYGKNLRKRKVRLAHGCFG